MRRMWVGFWLMRIRKGFCKINPSEIAKTSERHTLPSATLIFWRTTNGSASCPTSFRDQISKHSVSHFHIPYWLLVHRVV